MADEVEFTAEALPSVATPEPEAEPQPAVAAAPEATSVQETVAAKPKPARKPRVAKPAAAVVLAAPVKAPVRKARKQVTRKIPAAAPAPQAAVKPVRRASAKRPVVQGESKPTRKSSKIGTGMPNSPKFKEIFMATPFDFSKFQTSFADIQGKAKAAFEKSTAALGEANDFAKGNVEAVVESGKILSAGLQDLGATLVAETRGAFDAMSADAKELAAAKSPTEFFQLQSALMRKQFDGAVAQASKSTEAWLKLANETIAPLSSRVTLAVDKASKAA
jgi:hypothetical protein